MKLAWKTLARVMRRFGWGSLLVPLAAMSMALFGLHLWTIATVAFALSLAVWRPVVAAALVPLAMVVAGATGLVVASGVPGSPVSWIVSSSSQAVKPTPAPGFWTVDNGQTVMPLQMSVGPGGMVAANVPGQVVAVPPGTFAYLPPQGHGQPPRFRSLPINARKLAIDRQRVGPPRGFRKVVYTRRGPVMSPAGWWHGRLLVPLALILLTLGLWLAPRTMVSLVERSAELVQRLRNHMRENRWGVLLVPVALIGLTVFGVRPWTVGLVVAAVIVVIKWPRVAADLVPVALAIFALYGFDIAARWQAVSAAAFVGPGGPPFANLAQVMNPVQYGAVLVDSRQMALLAGAEASVFLALGAWLVPRTIGAHTRSMFVADPDPALAGQVARLTESRGHAIDAATSELRRIERDLHDGAQARLVALGMNLRAVERMLPASPHAAMALVSEARETSLRALNDLRNLVRGIYPPVLADRGLGHAVEALALDTSLPIELDINLPGRLTVPVESACYFAVAEALANAVKHSGAHRVHIRIQHSASPVLASPHGASFPGGTGHGPGMLRIEVADDGIGGADPARGTGLAGVERRLGTFDGILAVSSPPGGPTMIAMEVPCALSSPKTCSC
ncbi:MAG TPA: histidine kinase [Streptosporangiaceae bacterium]